MKSSSFRFLIGLTWSLVLVAGIANAQRRDRQPLSDFPRFSFSLGGGWGFQEAHQGLIDLNAELQVGLTPRLRLGLGVGYMKSGGRHGDEMGNARYDQRNGMMGGGSWNWPGFMMPNSNSRGIQDGQDLRVMPLSLNLYYGVPLGRKWVLFGSGGASYYFGSFESPAGTQRKNVWGGQAGLGAEFRLAQGISLFAEGGYRFAEFPGINSPQQVGGPRPLEWLNQAMGNLDRRIDGTVISRTIDLVRNSLAFFAPQRPKPRTVNFNGPSFILGVKFGI